jgi:farnesyl-diphosphate farnesyltransferase
MSQELSLLQKLKEETSFSRQNLPAFSRTFALAIPLLPDPNDIAIAYAICRINDTLEDSKLDQQLKLTIMNIFLEALKDKKRGKEKDLEGLLKNVPTSKGYKVLLENPFKVVEDFQKLPDDIRNIIWTYSSEMARGLADVSFQKIETMQDLIRYCDYAAGTVGKMTTDIWKARGFIPEETAKALMPSAVDLGRALQLVNIAKDLPVDHVDGRHFWPTKVLEDHGLNYDSIFNLGDRSAKKHALAVSSEIIDESKKYVKKGLNYIKGLPSGKDVEGADGIREFCGLSLALSAASLRVCCNNTELFVPGNEIKIGHYEVGEILKTVQEIVANEKELKSLDGFIDHLYELPGYTFKRQSA